LNHQELRNSLYSGPLNELLIDIAGHRLFDQIWGIPPYEDHYHKSEGYISPELAANKLFGRMKDCEIVLRFFAFRETDRIKGSVRGILDDYMKENRDAPPPQLAELRDVFLQCLQIAHAIFGAKTFRIRNAKGKWAHSKPLFDAVMVAIERLAIHEKKLIAHRAKIRASLMNLIRKPDVYEIVVGRPNTATAIKDRISIIYDLLKQFS